MKQVKVGTTSEVFPKGFRGVFATSRVADLRVCGEAFASRHPKSRRGIPRVSTFMVSGEGELF